VNAESRTVVKVGSSVLLNESGSINDSSLAFLARGTAALRQEGSVVLVCSGAVGHGSAISHRGEPQKVLVDRQAAAALGQGDVYAAVSRALGAHGLLTGQFLLTADEVADQKQFAQVRAAIQRVIDWGAVPVVNENDAITSEANSFENNDYLATEIASMVEASQLVFLSSIDGLYTDDPVQNPSASRIRVVEKPDQVLRRNKVRTGGLGFGTGGMYSKVIAAQMAAAGGTQTIICSGLDDSLRSLALGEDVGTRFLAPSGRTYDKRLGSRLRITGRRTRGTIVVDKGAAAALTTGKRSLLPVGITEVHGNFEAGDAVLIKVRQLDQVEERFRYALIGKGESNFASQDLDKVKGMQSDRVLEELPKHNENEPEAVHRDAFVSLSYAAEPEA
jgi:glutamate 5-kinase